MLKAFKITKKLLNRERMRERENKTIIGIRKIKYNEWKQKCNKQYSVRPEGNAIYNIKLQTEQLH